MVLAFWKNTFFTGYPPSKDFSSDPSTSPSATEDALMMRRIFIHYKTRLFRIKISTYLR
jgi:hypothetical protein